MNGWVMLWPGKVHVKQGREGYGKNKIRGWMVRTEYDMIITQMNEIELNVITNI